MHTPFALTQTTPTQNRSANQPSLSSSTSRRSFLALTRVCALLLVLLAGFSAAVRAQAPNWVQNSPATTPSGGSGYGYSMVDDAALGQVFMFSEGATWLWNGVNWTAQSTTSSPGARLFSQMDYDSVNQQVVLFGGCEDCQGSNTVLGDTWLWTGADWVQPTGLTMMPGGRYNAAMAYDPVNQQSVLFGGSSNTNFFGDTWLWNGTSWTQANPSTSPSARNGHVMAYLPTPQLPTPGQLVLFGGRDLNGNFLGDTWLWNGTTWTRASLSTNPPAREQATMAYDAALGQLVLFGGYEPSLGSSGSDTWLWNGTTWTQANPGTSPPARIEAAMAYDATIGQMVLFGGNGNLGFLNDTWSYEAPATLTVTSGADDGSAETLRTLIGAAAAGDTIVFAPSLTGQTITLDCGDPGFGTIVLSQNVTIIGPGASNLAISGNNACEVFQINSGVTATISGVTIENGSSRVGAGVNNAGELTLSNSNISGNSAQSNSGGFGGGVYNSGTVTVSNSTFSGNSADSEGGGIYNYSGTVTVSNSTFSTNSSYYGGGIYNDSGTVAMSNSTFSGNHSTQDDGQGGGIFNGGTMTVSNSTFSGNSAPGGGGIYNYGTLTLSNSTFSGNSASVFSSPTGAALFNFGYGGSSVTFKGVLMANNTPGSSCGNIGILVSDGYNLEDGSSCNFNQTGDQSNVTGAATYLGPLKNNGGPTQTVALLTGSTAIDAIPLNACTDAFGNPVIADQRGITRPQGAAGKCDIGAFEVQQTPTANVCPNGQTTPAPCSYPITLRYFIPAGTTLGTNPVRAVTQGAPNLDFTLTPSNICSPVGSANCVVSSSPCANLAGPAYCTVQVTFAPIAPGLRMGAVELTDSNNNPVATTLIPGLGNGPAIAFGPGVQIPLDINPGGIGLNGPWGVAVDAAGDLFIADAGNSRVVEVPAGCTNSSCQVVVPATGLMNPTGVAVDGAGDLFISDQGSNLVVEVPYLGNGTYGSQTTLPASGLSYPKGVAVDGAGNVFIADFGSSRIVELPYVGNGAYGPQTTVGSAIQSPSAVAVDSAGDLFIGQPEAIVEVTPSGVQTTLPFQSGTFQIPSGVAVDAAGDVFATDQTNGYATELSPLANGTYGTQTFLVESNSAGPTGVAVDAAGDVFVVENGYNKVVEFMRSQPPSLGFASTPPGQTSSDSPQSVTIQNIGNKALNAVSPGLAVTGPNFVQVAGSGTPADCSSGFALTAGGSCNLSISFTPQSSGPLSSTAVFTDNTLNASPSTMQTIALQGTGAGTPPAITSANYAVFTTGVYGSFTVTTTGMPTPSIMESGTLPNGLTFHDNGDGTGTLKGTPVSNGGNFSISFTAQNGVGSPATQAFTIILQQAPTFTSASSAVFTIGVAGSFTVTTASYPTASIMEAGPLPNGLLFHDNGNGTGTLKGTPLVFNGGNFGISFTAQNGIGSPVTEAFTIILQQPPTFTSASSAMFTIAAPNSFSVTTAGFPAPSIKESGALPPGVTLVDNHNGTATLSGTPSAGGSFPIVLTATNVVTATQQNFTLNVAGVSISPSPLNFGTAYLNSSTTLSLTLTNMTTSTVTIGSLSITPGTANAAAYKAISHCAAALKTGKSCTVAVTFLANAVGLQTATLNVSDSTIPTPHQIGLSAYVIDPVAQFNPTKLPFGTQAVNSSTTLPVTLTNAGQTPLNIGGISITGTNSGEFSEMNSCPASLASGASCTISVTFAPTVKGARTGTLTVIDNATGGQSTAALSGTGH